MTDREEGPDGTVCPLCAVGCRLTKREGETRATGRPGPANPNGRLCQKGIQAFERVPSDERLTDPLIRRDDTLVTVSWQRACQEVVDRTETTLEESGPDALAFLGAPHCTNEENYLLGKLARSLGTNNVDNRARHCHVSTARSLSERIGWPATTNSLDDLWQADVVLVVGANPAERQPIAFNSHIRPAVNAGAKLVQVDPVGNETTRLADEHLAPVPGTDALVFDTLCAQAVERGHVDREFVTERTAGFEEFAASLTAVDAAETAAIADVERADLERVGDILGEAERLATVVGTGVEEDDDSRATADALLNFLLLTGNVGRRGTGVHIFRGPPNEQGAIDAGCVPDRLPGHQPVTDAAARDRVVSEWGIDLPTDPGGTAAELLASFGSDVETAVVVGENPAVSKRDREWVRDRLDSLETLIVLEVRESGTTRHADVVLPAGTGVEKAGTVTNLDRQIQRLNPVSSPPGRARPDRSILQEVGRRLPSVETSFDYDGPEAVFAEFARVAPTHAGIGYGDLEGTSRRWPGDVDQVLYRETFETLDGRAPFVPTDRVAGPTSTEGFHLVVGGRASDVSPGTGVGGAVRMHPDEATDRGIEAGDTVSVSDGRQTVDATAEVADSVRRGAVYLHASVADPFVRAGTTTVTVDPATTSDRCADRR